MRAPLKTALASWAPSINIIIIIIIIYITPLQTSKRLGGKGGGAHEVNRRSVLSSHHGAVLVRQSFVLVWTFHLQLPRKHTTST